MSLAYIGSTLTKIVLTTFIFLGTVGNILNLFIFTRPTLLRSPCTLYLLATSIDNILVIYTTLLTRLLSNGFSYDITITSNLICKLRYYPGYVFLAVSPYFFTLASFDRYCSSSPSATRRLWSSKKKAKQLIIGAIIVACILYIHMPFFFEIRPNGTRFTCYARPGIYNTFYRFFYLFIYCLLPSIIMSIFCILTLINIRQQARQIAPAVTLARENHRRLDRHMIRMLFSQILTQVLCILPFAVLNTASIFINNATTIYSFLNSLTTLPLFVSYTTSFYVFTMASRIYRQEILKFIRFKQRNSSEREFSLQTITNDTKHHRKQKIITNETMN